LRVSYENYYYDISYLLFVTDRRAAKYPFSSHSCRLWLYAISCIWLVHATGCNSVLNSVYTAYRYLCTDRVPVQNCVDAVVY
jgi:hypothetical protein